MSGAIDVSQPTEKCVIAPNGEGLESHRFERFDHGEVDLAFRGRRPGVRGRERTRAVKCPCDLMSGLSTARFSLATDVQRQTVLPQKSSTSHSRRAARVSTGISTGCPTINTLPRTFGLARKNSANRCGSSRASIPSIHSVPWLSRTNVMLCGGPTHLPSGGPPRPGPC